MTQRDKIIEQLTKLSNDEIILMLQTGVINKFGLRCDYCVFNGKCSSLDYYNRNNTEYSCGIGINQFLNKEIEIAESKKENKKNRKE